MLENEIFFLTSNKHKYEEIYSIVEGYGFKICMKTGYKIEIQSHDLVEIAKYAALTAYMRLNKPLLVEDAGLFINALNGFPGPYSSYVFKTIGYHGILELMKNIRDRTAYFKSVAVLVYEPYILIGEGIVHGFIVEEPRGSRGFGFDPIFRPKDSEKTFAEMDIEEKNQYSHRAISVNKVFTKLKRMIDKEI